MLGQLTVVPTPSPRPSRSVHALYRAHWADLLASGDADHAATYPLLVAAARQPTASIRQAMGFTIVDCLLVFVAPFGRELDTTALAALMDDCFQATLPSRTDPDDENAVVTRFVATPIRSAPVTGVLTADRLHTHDQRDRCVELILESFTRVSQRVEDHPNIELLRRPTQRHLRESRAFGFVALALPCCDAKVVPLNPCRVCRPNGTIHYRRRAQLLP
jgi:hypothetical protein